MIDNKYLELLHGELDGANSPQESALLTAYLAANPEAQRLAEELRGMSNLLGEVKPVTPPAHLQYAIMNTIARRRAPRTAKHGQLAAFKNWLIEIFEPKSAFSFAGGLAVGVLLFALALQMTKDGASDSTKLYGTIGAPHTAEQQTASKPRIISHEVATGAMNWHREGDVLVVEITLAAAEAFDLIVLFEPSGLRCKGISVIDGAELPDAVLQAGRLQLSHVGEKSYRITFQASKEAAPAACVQFQRNGALLYDEKISF